MPFQLYIDLAASLTLNMATPQIIHDPFAFTSSTSVHSSKKKLKEDVLTYNEAMTSPFQVELYHAMHKENHMLANVFKCRELVPCTPNMKVLFDLELLHQKKFKAQFCACRNEQEEGID